MICPCRGVPSLSFASLQKSTPLSPLSVVLIFSSIPSGITSPWQNQTDFWWTWSVVASPGKPFSIGQARVTARRSARAPGRGTAWRASDSVAYFATTAEPDLNSMPSVPTTAETSSAAARAQGGNSDRSERRVASGSALEGSWWSEGRAGCSVRRMLRECQRVARRTRSGAGSNAGMSKKKKVRVELRKNREKPPRENDLTRDFRKAPAAPTTRTATERVRAKGDLSRYRTVVQDAADPEPACRSVDTRPSASAAGCCASTGCASVVETDDGRIFRCAVRRLLKSLATDERNVVTTGDVVWMRPARSDAGVRSQQDRSQRSGQESEAGIRQVDA